MSIRLVVDFETGRPKGFAFVEYEDAATALSAIRNLNGYECNNRPVRYLTWTSCWRSVTRADFLVRSRTELFCLPSLKTVQ